MKRFAFALALFWALASPAFAQGPIGLCILTINTVTGGYNCQIVNTGSPLPVAVAPEPLSTTVLVSPATGTTGAVAASLSAVSGITNYLCGFDVSASGSGTGLGPITVSGLNGGSLTYELSPTSAGVNFNRSFNPCLPASASNTAITVTTTAALSATAVDVNTWGFRK